MGSEQIEAALARLADAREGWSADPDGVAILNARTVTILEEAARLYLRTLPVTGSDAELIEAVSNIARAMKYGPDQEWLEMAADRLQALTGGQTNGE